MIARLQGNAQLLDTTSVIVDVNGVGYKVHAPVSVLSKLKQSETVVFFTHTHVREDILELYGFLDYQDLKLFEMFLGVSGIGCKTALGIFANGTREEIVNAVLKADIGFFSGIPRLGTKNAQKLIIELKGKLGIGGDLDLSDGEVGSKEVMDALKTIGYSAQEAQQAIRAIHGKGETTSEKVRLALRFLGK